MKPDFTNNGSVNKIQTRGREGVKKDHKISDIIYGCSIRLNEIIDKVFLGRILIFSNRIQ